MSEYSSKAVGQLLSYTEGQVSHILKFQPKCTFKCFFFFWEVIRYHRKPCGLKVGLLVEVGKLSSRHLYTELSSNEAVALFLLLPPHIIHHSLTVDPPDSLINPKQRTD